MSIYSMSAYVSSYSRIAPLISVTLSLDTEPESVHIEQGGISLEVLFSHTGERLSFSFIQRTNDAAIVRLTTEREFSIDPLMDIDIRDMDDEDDGPSSPEYPADAPGLFNPEEGMVDVTELGGLYFPLADTNRLQVEIQLLEEFEYPTWVQQSVHPVDYSMLYSNIVFNNTFGNLSHPSNNLVFSFDSRQLRYLPDYQTGEPLNWQPLVVGTDRVVQDSFRMIARSVHPQPLSSNFIMEALYDDRLYGFDYYCDFIQGEEIR